MAEFPDEGAGFKIPDLDATVRATRDDADFVELERGDAVVVRGKTVDWIVGFQGPHTHGAVGATGYEDGAAQLELADEGSMALQYGLTGSSIVVGCLAKNGKDFRQHRGRKIAYPSCGFQTLTLVSRLPVATLFPSKAMA